MRLGWTAANEVVFGLLALIWLACGVIAAEEFS